MFAIYWKGGLCQVWRNWRKEEQLINWEISSKAPWHKHIRLNTDYKQIKPRKSRLLKATEKVGKKDLYRDYYAPIGRKRFKLKAQAHTIQQLQEISKSGEIIASFTTGNYTWRSNLCSIYYCCSALFK